MKPKKKVIYILSQINNAIAFEWIVQNLDREKFDLSFVLILQEEGSVIENFLRTNQVPCYRLNYLGKKDLLKTAWKIFQLLRREKPDVVHTHLFEASLLGLTVARLLGIKKRIYTRHHSTFHHTYFPRAVKYDRWINRMATDIVSISEVTTKVLREMEGVPVSKIHLIHHGFDLKAFVDIRKDEIEGIRQKYHLSESDFVIGVVARHVNWKGIEYIIEAFQSLLLEIPEVKLVMANANGDYKAFLDTKLKSLPPEKYVQIEFERNIPALYQCMQVFVHVPIDPMIEAFGQIYVEAMAAGVPCVFTLSGIAHDYVVNHKNALLVAYQNSNEIKEAILKLYHHQAFRDQLTAQAQRDVFALFGLEKMMEGLEKLYLSN